MPGGDKNGKSHMDTLKATREALHWHQQVKALCLELVFIFPFLCWLCFEGIWVFILIWWPGFPMLGRIVVGCCTKKY